MDHIPRDSFLLTHFDQVKRKDKIEGEGVVKVILKFLISFFSFNLIDNWVICVCVTDSNDFE